MAILTSIQSFTACIWGGERQMTIPLGVQGISPRYTGEGSLAFLVSPRLVPDNGKE